MPAHDPNATLHLPPPRVTEPGPTVVSPQSTMRVQPEMRPLNPPAFVASNAGGSETSRRSALPWLLGIAIVIGFSGVLIALILTFGRSQPNERIASTPTPTASPTQSVEVPGESEESPPSSVKLATPTPTRSPERQPTATPGSVTVTRATPEQTPRERPKPMFAVLNNISFNGTRITYYPRPSFGMCQADCASNANCRGFTWIRPGAYNPGDSAMCYLLSAVTARVPHACCISAVKN
jgi:PAN domain